MDQRSKYEDRNNLVKDKIGKTLEDIGVGKVWILWGMGTVHQISACQMCFSQGCGSAHAKLHICELRVDT